MSNSRINLFDWLETKYNSSEIYKEEYTLEEFCYAFFENTFNFNVGSIFEGFIADTSECDDEDFEPFLDTFCPFIEIDMKNKTITMNVE